MNIAKSLHNERKEQIKDDYKRKIEEKKTVLVNSKELDFRSTM